jgi:hypothetical protein
MPEYTAAEEVEPPAPRLPTTSTKKTGRPLDPLAVKGKMRAIKATLAKAIYYEQKAKNMVAYANSHLNRGD